MCVCVCRSLYMATWSSPFPHTYKHRHRGVYRWFTISLCCKGAELFNKRAHHCLECNRISVEVYIPLISIIIRASGLIRFNRLISQRSLLNRVFIFFFSLCISLFIYPFMPLKLSYCLLFIFCTQKNPPLFQTHKHQRCEICLVLKWCIWFERKRVRRCRWCRSKVTLIICGSSITFPPPPHPSTFFPPTHFWICIRWRFVMVECRRLEWALSPHVAFQRVLKKFLFYPPPPTICCLSWCC